jgi:glycosyltransferase involved in cell wall biosynthesis
MKTIALMTLKNEEWIIGTTFPILNKIADKIIVANNNSTDNSAQMLSRYNVEIIEHSNQFSNAVRWRLLDKARESYGVNNLIICIDADEFIPPTLFSKNKEKILSKSPGTSFTSPWVQVWRETYQYRSDKSVWNPRNNKKPFMFIDDGVVDYKRVEGVLDHVSRIPEKNIKSSIDLKLPLIHLQFLNWRRSQVKQLWYQCFEIVNGIDVNEVNARYKVASDESNIKYKKLKKSWTKDVYINPDIKHAKYQEIWHIEEIKTLVNQHGFDKFKNLDSWNTQIVKDIFNLKM